MVVVTWVITRLCRDCLDMTCLEVCPVNCIPVDPGHAETNAQLWAKYRVLQIAAGNPLGEAIAAGPLPAPSS